MSASMLSILHVGVWFVVCVGKEGRGQLKKNLKVSLGAYKSE
jgi:hypothetical protein